MVKIFETQEDVKSQGACDIIRQDLKDCILNSDCVQKEKIHPKDCLKLKKDSVSIECHKLRQLLYECKRSMLDPRHRFRGRKDINN